MTIPIPHDFPFDPTYGYTLETLRQVRPPDGEPDDFDAFWQELKTRSDAVDPEASSEELESPLAGYRFFQCRYSCLGDFRIGAWVILPEDETAIREAWVVGHGYGGREEPEWGHAAPDRAIIFPVAPGFHISPDPRVPQNDCWKHVLCGIEDRESYILGPCVAALWQARRVLEEKLPQPVRYHYLGWSFGGGLGALMLPWEPMFKSAELGQPTFGHHPIRLQCESVGSGEPVRRSVLENPRLKTTLSYFDSALAIQRVTRPTVFACSLFDPSVPPPGQFAVANAHPGPKWISTFSTGHFEYEYDSSEEERTHQQNLQQLFER